MELKKSAFLATYQLGWAMEMFCTGTTWALAPLIKRPQGIEWRGLRLHYGHSELRRHRIRLWICGIPMPPSYKGGPILSHRSSPKFLGWSYQRWWQNRQKWLQQCIIPHPGSIKIPWNPMKSHEIPFFHGRIKSHEIPVFDCSFDGKIPSFDGKIPRNSTFWW